MIYWVDIPIFPSMLCDFNLIFHVPFLHHLLCPPDPHPPHCPRPRSYLPEFSECPIPCDALTQSFHFRLFSELVLDAPNPQMPNHPAEPPV